MQWSFSLAAALCAAVTFLAQVRVCVSTVDAYSSLAAGNDFRVAAGVGDSEIPLWPGVAPGDHPGEFGPQVEQCLTANTSVADCKGAHRCGNAPVGAALLDQPTNRSLVDSRSTVSMAWLRR